MFNICGSVIPRRIPQISKWESDKPHPHSSHLLPFTVDQSVRYALRLWTTTRCILRFRWTSERLVSIAEAKKCVPDGPYITRSEPLPPGLSIYLKQNPLLKCLSVGEGGAYWWKELPSSTHLGHAGGKDLSCTRDRKFIALLFSV